MRRAFSYARFSTAEQSKGFSLDRQLGAAKLYCERNGLTLDDRTFLDAGVSGYHGSNAAAGELSKFLDLVKAGRIPKGSVLIVENTDRLSRLPPDEANRIITTIVNEGIDIVTTSPEQVYTKGNINKLATWLPLQISNCLAREESEKKADRLKDAWRRKREDLANGKKMTKAGPFWLRLTADRTAWVVVEDKADVLRKMFRWAIDGYGVAKICELLNDSWPEGLTGKGWQPANVRKILRWRAAIGEFQAFVGTCAKKGGIKSTRRPYGDPVKGYYPSVVTESEFYKAQAALDGRRKGGGRRTGTPNLFNGILYDARDGQRMVISNDRLGKVLVSGGAIRKLKGSVFRSVRYDFFERAILLCLKELKPSDILGKSKPAEDDVETWSGKLAAVNHNIEKTRQRAATAEDPTVYLDLLDDYAKQRKQIIKRLEEAKAKTASESSDNLGECISLIRLMDGTQNGELDELRRKLKSVLDRLVKRMYVVIAGVGRNRLYDVQIDFAEGRRNYIIFFRPPLVNQNANLEARWFVHSTTLHPSMDQSEADRGAGPCLSWGRDLRNQDEARGVAEGLSSMSEDEIGLYLAASWPLDQFDGLGQDPSLPLP